MTDAVRAYPRSVSCGGKTIELSLLTAQDQADLEAFVATIPEHDLLFLSSDITHKKVMNAWIRSAKTGRVKSLLAREGGVIIGCTAIVLNILSWSRHVGELRVLLAPEWRGQGLGTTLMQECFVQALELGLEKLCMQATVDQPAAIVGFENLGFRAEALFHNHVKDSEGRLYDLAVLSHDVARVQSRMAALGIPGAIGA